MTITTRDDALAMLDSIPSDYQQVDELKARLRSYIESHTGEVVAWLRDAHNGEGDECLVPCAKGDPGGFPVYASPVQPVLEWQPFDTAKEDGNIILVYRPDAGVFTAHYVEEDAHLSSPMNPPEGDSYWFSTSGEDLTDDLPSHWQPLPAPPLSIGDK